MIPIQLKEIFQLSKADVDLSSIGMSAVSMESDRFICVRQSHQVIVFDMDDPSNPIRLPVSTDSAIMNPSLKLLGLKDEKTLRIFNLQTESVAMEYVMEEDVVFWKWIRMDAIGIVTDTAVYHWMMEDQGRPVKVFHRHASLEDCQIVNYCTDPMQERMALVGYSLEEDQFAASVQLYASKRDDSHILEGHAVAFTQFKMEGNPAPSNLFIVALRTSDRHKLSILETGLPAADNQPYQQKSTTAPISVEAASDFPIAVQLSPKHGLIFVVTKFGYVYVFDVESNFLIAASRISSETIFATTFHDASSSMICVNRTGQVLMVSIDESALVPYILSSLDNAELARRLEVRINSNTAEHSEYN